MRLLFTILVVGLIVAAVWFGGLHYYAGVPLPLLTREERSEAERMETVGSSVLPAVQAISPLTPSPVSAVTPPPPPISEQQPNSADFYSLRNARALEQSDPTAVRSILSLPWVADGISGKERETIEALIWLAATQEQLFQELTGKPWLANGEAGELEVVILGLELIASKDPKAALDLIGMPFLFQLEPADVLAVDSLSHVAYFDLPSFRMIMGHPTCRDGITDREAKVVGLLSDVTEVNPSLALSLLDPAATTIEERTIGLPLAGEVTMAIVRTQPGAARSMDLLENAVRSAESFIGAPFPARYIALLFEDAIPGHFGGTNNGLHMTILPDHDVDGDSYEAKQASRVIAHEVAHYYWRWSQPWLDEGAAEFTAAFAEQALTGHPLEPVNYPCGPAYTIRYLVSQDLDEADERYWCNYAVGERFFLELYRAVGEQEFRQGFRNLYRIADESAYAGADAAGILQVQELFPDRTEIAGSLTADSVAQVIDRWYEGNVLASPHGPDSRPVVGELPTVNGWVNRAYVSLEEVGPPVKSFSVADGGEWAWLTLEYSHDYAGPPTELTFEVVEFYEDGFPYRRSNLIIEADRRYSGGVQWLSIGPGPGQTWAPGRHWVYVHHEGRKVAQVEFEVTP